MDYLKAFLIGGAICLVGQLLIDKTKLTPARILVSYVVAGVILGAVGLYEPFAEFAGAGAAVPLTGFGNTLAKGVREAVDEQGFLGIFIGGLRATAGGITAAITAGLLAALPDQVELAGGVSEGGEASDAAQTAPTQPDCGADTAQETQPVLEAGA